MDLDITNNKPLVSVCMITYNHEAYIAEAIEGVLMQKTTFPVELIISDDCSRDNTREVVEKYALQYPNLIIADLPAQNRGMMANVQHNLSLARGKYIAFCEGDDYWVDPLKLQKQANFMEENPDYGLVYGKATHYIQERGVFAQVYGDNQCDFKSLLFRLPMLTLTSCFRTSILLQYENENIDKSKWKLADSGLMIYCSLKSKIHFIDEIFGVYRVLSNSASHTPDPIKQYNFLYSYLDISTFFVSSYYEGDDKHMLLDKLSISKLWLLISIAGQHKGIDYYDCLVAARDTIKELPKTKKQKLISFASNNKLFYRLLISTLRFKHRKKNK